jgi:hypothetical protein
LEKLVQWRGDDENGRTELEDVFREVIVISDDDESDTDQGNGPRPNRDSSVEILPSAFVGEVQTRPVNYANTPAGDAFHDLSDDEAPPGFRFLPMIPRPIRVNKPKVDRRGFSRYQAWDRARDRYRERVSVSLQTNVLAAPVQAGPVLYPTQQSYHESVNRPSELIYNRQVKYSPQWSNVPLNATSSSISSSNTLDDQCYLPVGQRKEVALSVSPCHKTNTFTIDSS